MDLVARAFAGVSVSAFGGAVGPMRPDATPEAASAGHDEARRDDRPCPRDPRCAWPAMAHLVLDPLGPPGLVRCGMGMLVRGHAGIDDPAVRGCPRTCGPRPRASRRGAR